jgi:hypothetical protein
MANTILPADSIDQLTRIRTDTARYVSSLYILGSQARTESPDLETMLYQAADHLNEARTILARAVLLAAAQREETP